MIGVQGAATALSGESRNYSTKEIAAASYSKLLKRSWQVSTYLHLVLDPGSDGIGLCGKLAPQSLISVLASQLFLQGLIPDGHQLLHLSGPKDNQG